jgi:hypothetical protein
VALSLPARGVTILNGGSASTSETEVNNGIKGRSSFIS